MTDNSTKPVQATLQFGEFNFTLRTDTVEELLEHASALGTNADALLTAFSDVKQVALANESFAAPAPKPVGFASGGSSFKGASSSTTPPPAAGAKTNDPGVCKHGLPWKDTRNADGSTAWNKAKTELLKADLYCQFQTDDWKERCKPIAINPR